MEPLNLMVSLSHFADDKGQRDHYLSDGPRPSRSRRSRRGQAEYRSEDSHGWLTSAWRGVTRLATR